ncbi:mucin-22-like [Littorina saxatilis]|uniref:Uncharacterized protein n=1 Tax=Littorina saxatilis TaxID=31220 RepID=A0AAN9AJZ9_9CAEN
MILWKLLFFFEVAVVVVTSDCDVAKWLDEMQNFGSQVLTFLDIPAPERSTDDVIRFCSESVRDGGMWDASVTCDSLDDETTLEDAYDQVLEDLGGVCETACANYETVRECAKSVPDTAQLDQVCGGYTSLENDCIHKLLDATRCPIRDRLFLSAVRPDYKEALYRARCIPRPAVQQNTTLPPRTTTTPATTTPATTTILDTSTSQTTVTDAITSQVIPSTLPTTLRQITTQVNEDSLPATTETAGFDDRTTTSVASPAGPACNVPAARVCVAMRQVQVDAAASDVGGGHALVAACLAQGEVDDVTRCFHDNTEGCQEGVMAYDMVKRMWDDAVYSAHTLCQHTCPGYKQAFQCVKGLQAEPMSLLCRSRKTAIACVPCPLAADMLHVMIRRRVSVEHLDICETEAPCPDLIKALEIMERCARIYWVQSDLGCNETWSVEQCLVDGGIYSLSCRNISRAMAVVLAGYEESRTICTTTTSTTTPTTTTTSTTTTTPTTTTTSTTTTTPTTTTTTTTTPPTTTTTSTTATTTSSPGTTTTFITSTVDYEKLRSIIFSRCEVDFSTIVNRNLSDVITAMNDVTNDTDDVTKDTDELLRSNLDICIKLISFTDCLNALPECKDSNQQRLCQTALPAELGQAMTRETVSWCARAVREAATDMDILRQGTAEKVGKNQTVGGWRSRTNSTCMDGGSSRLYISIFLLFGSAISPHLLP